MENNVLKKRLNTFKSSNGKLRNISDDVIIDVLRAWEQWPGTTADLYRELGLSKMQMVIILKKAKKLVKNGAVPESDFKEIELPPQPVAHSITNNCGIELIWNNNIIRFGNSELLLDFLKKAA